MASIFATNKVKKSVRKMDVHAFEQELNRTLNLHEHHLMPDFEKEFNRQFTTFSGKLMNKNGLKGLEHAANKAHELLNTKDSEIVMVQYFGHLAGAMLASLEYALEFKFNTGYLFSNQEMARFEHVFRAFYEASHHIPDHVILKRVEMYERKHKPDHDQKRQLSQLAKWAAGHF